MPVPDARPRRSYRGVSPDERDALRRRKLLDAALERFGTDGWNATSVAALCREAGVTTRNFYELFADREELFLALYDELTTRVLVAVGEAVSAAPRELPAIARAGLEASVGIYAGDPRIARVVLMEVHGISVRVEQHRRDAIDAMAELVAASMAALMAHGGVPPRNPRLTAIALVGAVVELLVHHTAHGGVHDVDELVEETQRLFVLAFGLASA